MKSTINQSTIVKSTNNCEANNNNWTKMESTMRSTTNQMVANQYKFKQCADSPQKNKMTAQFNVGDQDAAISQLETTNNDRSNDKQIQTKICF